MARACVVCSATDSRQLVRLEGVPVLCNVPRATAEEARAVARGDLDLAACNTCGHVYNVAFDASSIDYAPGYENSLFFSPRLRAYAERQAAALVDRYLLHGREVVELGCGDAGFLALLAAAGAHCSGYDPSAAANTTTPEGVRIIARDFSASVGPLLADLVVCRHVLEHVEAPHAFLAGVRATLIRGAQTGVFFEVPNALSTLRDLAIWDLIYEHPSYFWSGSLATVFARAGFRVERVEETFEGQFLTVHARPTDAPATDELPNAAALASLHSHCDAFVQAYQDKRDFWATTLARLAAERKRAVIWGAGSKGVMFLNVFSSYDVIDAAVDVNPRKHGLHIAGSGQPIVSPETLPARRPSVIILMNPAYESEVRTRCRELGLDVEILCA